VTGRNLDTSFIFVEAAWSVEEALEVIEAVAARWIVVRLFDGDSESYHPIPRTRALALRKHVAEGRGTTMVKDVLDLPTQPTDTRLTQSTVVIERGLVRGVATPLLRARGLGRHWCTALPTPLLPDSDTQPDTSATGRYLKAELPTSVDIQKRVSLLVIITRTSVMDAVALKGEMSTGDQIDVSVKASGAVAVVGTGEATLTLTDEEEVLHRFVIEGMSVGAGQVIVYAFQGGKLAGRVQVDTEVVDAGARTGSAVAAEAATFDLSSPLPELSVFVMESKGERRYDIRITACDASLGLNMAKFGPVTLDQDVELFFGAFYKDIEDILRSDDSSSEKMDRLDAKGDYLFEKVVPRELRALLWRLRGSIKSVNIQSEEPWIPWELCKLSGPDASGTIVPGGFLCEDYAVTRWLMEYPMYTELTLRNVGLIVPPDSGLVVASAEQEYMLGLAGADRKVTPIAPRANTLRAELSSAAYDGLHFTGHGSYAAENADRSAIRLEGGKRFTPEYVSGPVANLRQKRTLVFLNACEIGRSGTALGTMAGWPRAFLAAGAGAFIGPYWKIGDGSGSLFAQTFYDELLDGATVGEAARRARLAIKVANDPTWIAYTVFAHADARVVPGAPAGGVLSTV